MLGQSRTRDAGGGDLQAIKKKVKIYCALEIGFGLFFWCWSLFIIANGTTSFDSGIIIFLFAMAAGITGQEALKQEQPSEELLGRHILLLKIAHGLIVLAFEVGGIIGLVDGDFGRFVYCLLVGFAWGVSGYFILGIAERFKALKLANLLPVDTIAAATESGDIESRGNLGNKRREVEYYSDLEEEQEQEQEQENATTILANDIDAGNTKSNAESSAEEEATGSVKHGEEDNVDRFETEYDNDKDNTAQTETAEQEEYTYKERVGKEDIEEQEASNKEDEENSDPRS